MMPMYPYVYNTPMMPMYQQPAYTMPQPQQQIVQSQPQQSPDSLINGGYVVVPSVDDVKKYPVAPGNLVTFKIENEPIVIEKSMGRSQFASPEMKFFRLQEFNQDEDVKETPVQNDIKDSIKHIESRLTSLSDSYTELKKLLSKKQETKPVKKEENHESRSLGKFAEFHE